MDYLGKGEVLTNTDLVRFVNFFEGNWPFVYIEKVWDLWVQLMKNGVEYQKYQNMFDIFFIKALTFYTFYKIKQSINL